MTVSYIGATSAESTSVTLPSHQAGDLIVMWALRYGSLLGPTVPAGWHYRYLSQRAGGTSLSIAISAKVAASSAETSGTWTNATHLLAAVYRDDANYIVLADPTYRRANSTTINYNGKAAATTVSNSEGPLGTSLAISSAWVLGLVACHLNTAGIDTAPSGMTHRHMLTGATQGRIALADTNAAVSSFTAASITVAATTDYLTNVVEIIDTGVSKASAGGLYVAGGLTGGMRG